MNRSRSRRIGDWTRRSTLQLSAALPWMLFLPSPVRAAQKTVPSLAPFVVYYGQDADLALADYALAVIDSSVDPAAVSSGNSVFLGYLSLGEVASYRPYYADVAAEGLLEAANPNWPDARFVDMRAAGWRRRVIDELIPGLLASGFDGVFFDTLDDAEYLESSDPEKFAGMIQGAAQLVTQIRRHFPKIPLMINRGYAVLPRIAGDFDMLLGESVRANYKGDGTFALVSDADYHWQCDQMLAARKRNPHLHLFSLDYWDPTDEAGIARLYAAERANGFIPYVATPDLSKIVPEP